MKKNKLVLAFTPLFILALFLMILPSNMAQAGLWDMQDDTLGEIETTFADVGIVDDPQEMAVQIIKVFLGFIGLIAVVVIIWGGFRWMNAGGNDDELKKSKQIIIRALVGLIIIIASYAITEFTVYFVEDALDDW